MPGGEPQLVSSATSVTRLGALALVVGVAMVVYALASPGGHRAMTGQVRLNDLPNGESCAVDGFVIPIQGSATLAHAGEMTVTASNCARGALDTGPGVIFDGTATFAAADGSTIEGTVNIDTGEMLGDVDGWISY